LRFRQFVESLVAAAERYRELPDKFIDTNMIWLSQAIVSLTIGVAVLYTQNLVVNSCVIPIFEIKNDSSTD
jgi:hypothetical protein